MDFVKDSVFNQTYPYESDLIDVKKYFDEFGKLLISFETCQNDKCKSNEFGCQEENCKNDEFYTKFLSLNKEQLKELKERTSINHLTCPGETKPRPKEFYKKFDEVLLIDNTEPTENEVPKPDLVSVHKRTEMEVSKIEFPRDIFKYCNYQWCQNNDTSVISKLHFQSEDLSNLVASVKVYYPFLSSNYKSNKMKLLQEIHILGNQNLSQLRDKIICFLDYIGDKDASLECFLKDVGYNITAKDEYPSSFIFIEKTFYNDTRTSNLIDMSKVLRNWASERGLGEFESKSMENTNICDINLRIGRPYVFQHQGNCEHIIVFSDIRFLEMSDSKSTSYPKIHCTGRFYGKHCMMCGDSYAKWLVVGSERLTHDKTYLCKKCFYSYNYINGRKIGNFEAYKYVDPVALL